MYLPTPTERYIAYATALLLAWSVPSLGNFFADAAFSWLLFNATSLALILFLLFVKNGGGWPEL